MSNPKTFIEEIGPRAAILHVVRTCGHTDKLSYAGKDFAEAERAHMESLSCLDCRKSVFIEVKRQK